MKTSSILISIILIITTNFTLSAQKTNISRKEFKLRCDSIKIYNKEINALLNSKEKTEKYCTKLQSEYENYLTNLNLLKTKNRWFIKGEKEVNTNIRKLIKRTNINYDSDIVKFCENIQNTIDKYCNKVDNGPIVKPIGTLSAKDHEIITGKFIDKYRKIFSDSDKGYSVYAEEIGDCGKDLFIDVEYYLKEGFLPGEYLMPDSAQFHLEKICKEIQKDLEIKKLPQSTVVCINITGFADKIPVSASLKYTGLNKNNSCKEIYTEYFLLNKYDDTNFERKAPIEIKCGEQVLNNERLALIRTQNPKEIIYKILSASTIIVSAFPIPYEEGGRYRRIEVQFLVPDFFLSEFTSLKASEINKIRQIVNDKTKEKPVVLRTTKICKE